MPTVNPAAFARTAQLHKANGHRAALVIGFDGGSALIGHSPAAELVRELEGDRYSGSRLRIPRDAWREQLLDHNQRAEFLYRHTRSPRPTASQDAPDTPASDIAPLDTLANEMPALDMPAFRVIVDLVREGYVRTIVATDTAGDLHGSLTRVGVQMEHFNCVTQLPGVLEQLPVRAGTPLFVDGGELLLDGCEPNSFGYEGEQLRDAEEALNNFLGRFTEVYCWGWCDINVPIDRICPDRGGFLYALGRYTIDAIRVRYPVVTIEHPGDDRDTATTAIVHAIGKTLFPRAQTAPQRPATKEPVPPTGSGVIGQNRYPLLPLDVLNHLRDQAHKPITVVCMDGAEVRHRSTAWLAESLRQQGRRCRVRASADPVVLGQYLFMSGESESDLCLLGHFDSSPVVPMLYPMLLRDMVLPKELLEGEESNRRRIMLFGPAEMNSLFLGNSQIEVIAVYVNQWLVPATVANWLVKTFEPHLSEVDAGRLASIMVTDSERYKQFAADWLYDVAELWQADIERLSRDRARDEQPPLEFDDFEGVWTAIRERYEQRLETLEHEQLAAFEPNFDLGPVMPREDGTPPPSGQQDPQPPVDFDLGLIIPHGLDDGPETGSGDSGLFELGPITPR